MTLEFEEKMQMIDRITLGVLSSVGFLISLYFLFVYHNLMPADARWIPKFCRMDQTSCKSILSTPDARVFGLPNFYLGIGFYAAVFAAAVFTPTTDLIRTTLIVVSGLSVATSLFLSYSLFVRLKARCVLCFVSHVINVVMFLLL